MWESELVWPDEMGFMCESRGEQKYAVMHLEVATHLAVDMCAPRHGGPAARSLALARMPDTERLRKATIHRGEESGCPERARNPTFSTGD